MFVGDSGVIVPYVLKEVIGNLTPCLGTVRFDMGPILFSLTTIQCIILNYAELSQ
jgi:hypothetical protein